MSVLRPLVLWLVCAPLLAQTAFVSGSVYGDGNQQLNDMTVAAYTLSGDLAATTATDSQGRYLLALPAATYRLRRRVTRAPPGVRRVRGDVGGLPARMLLAMLAIFAARS